MRVGNPAMQGKFVQVFKYQNQVGMKSAQISFVGVPSFSLQSNMLGTHICRGSGGSTVTWEAPPPPLTAKSWKTGVNIH